MLNKVAKVLEKPVCNHCLGRQFSKLLSGHTNEERGETLRKAVAFALDADLLEQKVSNDIKERIHVDLSNFKNFEFRNQNLKEVEWSHYKFSCSVCNDFFFQNAKISNLAEKIAKKLKNYEFETFLIGCRPSKILLKNEEELWERIGIDYCEPI